MIDVERADAEAGRPLRDEVLRGGVAVAVDPYPADAVHLVARDLVGRVVSCGTFFPDPLDGQPAWRLRGMATAPDMRGRGYGQAVIEAGVILVREAGSATLWCNARTSALGFYRRMGFETRGQEFLTANGIPHFVAVRALP